MSILFYLLAVVLFVLAAFGVDLGGEGAADLIAWGLASFAFAHVVEPLVTYGRSRA